jgi:hypothetical protein
VEYQVIAEGYASGHCKEIMVKGVYSIANTLATIKRLATMPQQLEEGKFSL